MYARQEFPLCYYKVVVICASELMDSNQTDMATRLLYVLMGATAALLLLVVADRPYRDSQGHDGATDADKLQMLALACQLANYGLGWWCLETQHERQAIMETPYTETGSYLNMMEELGAALLSLLFVVGPLVPPGVRLFRARRKLRKEKLENNALKSENPLNSSQ